LPFGRTKALPTMVTLPIDVLTCEPVTSTRAFAIPISEKGAAAKDVAPKNMVDYLPTILDLKQLLVQL